MRYQASLSFGTEASCYMIAANSHPSRHYRPISANSTVLSTTPTLSEDPSPAVSSALGASNGVPLYANFKPTPIKEYNSQTSTEVSQTQSDTDVYVLYALDRPTATNPLSISATSGSGPVTDPTNVRSIPSSSSMNLGAIIYYIIQPPPLSTTTPYTGITGELQASFTNAAASCLPGATKPSAQSNTAIGGQTPTSSWHALTLSDATTLNVPPPSALTVGGTITVPNVTSTNFVAIETLVPGGPALTVHSQVVSLAPFATALVLGTTTIPIAGIARLSPQPSPVTVITSSTQVITADWVSGSLDGFQTVVPGTHSMTVSGTLISLETGGNGIVVGSSTFVLSRTTQSNVATATETSNPKAFEGVAGKTASIAYVYATILTGLFIANAFMVV